MAELTLNARYGNFRKNAFFHIQILYWRSWVEIKSLLPHISDICTFVLCEIHWSAYPSTHLFYSPKRGVRRVIFGFWPFSTCRKTCISQLFCKFSHLGIVMYLNNNILQEYLAFQWNWPYARRSKSQKKNFFQKKNWFWDANYSFGQYPRSNLSPYSESTPQT